LNSSKIRSSIFEPVSISAVPRIVSDPPPSMLRAEPKNFFGNCSALAFHAAREQLAVRRRLDVARARQPRDRVEEDDHVLARLHHAARLLDHHVGHLDVAPGGLVEGGADHLAIALGDHALEVGHFLRALVEQQDDQVRVRRVLHERFREHLQQDRLARARRRDDQAALTAADRRDQVDDAHLQRIVRRALEDHALVRGRAASAP
jgi:hypothetical protein